MSNFKLIPLLLVNLFIVSCGTDSNPKEWIGEWHEMGLEDQKVNALSYSQSYLFTGTDEGVYKKSIINTDDWKDIGLRTDTTKVTKVISWSSEHLLASVKYNSIRAEDKVLFESTDGGDTWTGWKMSTPEAPDAYSYIYHLSNYPENTSTLFGYSGYVLRSIDSGQTWERLFAGSFSEFLYVSDDHPNQIWTGGWNSFFQPYLAKSEDGGDSWVNLNEEIFYNAEVVVNAVVIHPEKEHTVLAGVGNVIRKSTDGGETWEHVLSGYAIWALKNSHVKPDRVYASGVSPSGQLFVAVSDDYGDTWEVVTNEKSPGDIQTNDMIVTNINGSETLFFGTSKGVYSLRFEE